METELFLKLTLSGQTMHCPSLPAQHKPSISRHAGFCLLFLALLATLLSGCSSVQTDKTSGVNLEKQIERQQEAYRLKEEPEKQEKLSREEYERLGDRRLGGNDINRAYFYYVKALEQAPDNVPLLHKQGSLLLKKKKFVDAEKVYRKILSLAAKDGLAYEGLGRALMGQNKTMEAEKAFKDGLALNNELWQSHHFLGLAYSGQEQYDKAVAEFKLALQYKPQESSVLNNLAVTYCLLGQYDQAEPILKRLAATTKDKKTYNNLALASVRLGKYDEALAAFKNGAKNESSAYYNMGVEYLALEKYPEAIEAFEKAIALNPQYYPAAVNNLERAKKALE